jgi:hypothetical protein
MRAASRAGGLDADTTGAATAAEGALVTSSTGIDGWGGAGMEGVEAPGASGGLAALGATRESEVPVVAA